ncbi:MAG: AraC family transcriptional regulator [Candidatus Limivivens sp.]|nr:AraC family transcriptional regulator [Candidatus Limivivens sp.]
MEKVTFYGETDGVSLEQMVRSGKFDMRVKHFHTQYEIFYIVEGERVFFFHNREYIARAGDLILVDSDLIHMTKSASEEDEGHNRIILYITREKMESYDRLFPALQMVQFFHDYYGVYHLDQEQQDLIRSLFRSLRHALTQKERNYRLGIDFDILSYFFKLMSFVRRHQNLTPHDADKPKHQAAYGIADYLSQNCERTVSLDELSEKFYLSKYYICRIFKEVTGYTISEYTNIHRIRKAKRYLEETDMSISDITYALGYESVTYFERMFKTYMTLSPLKYRKTLNTVTYTNNPTEPEEILQPPRD